MRILDLFCGQGGAAMGLHRYFPDAEIVGVDTDAKQGQRYPFTFVCGDALEYPLDGYDLIWASPPCQAYSKATAWRGSRENHPNLIPTTRDRLLTANSPWIIENVEGARRLLNKPVMLCGTMFGLPVRSHRYFELSIGMPPVLLPPCRHRTSDASRDHGSKQTESKFREAIECSWMTVLGARQAVLPCYSEYLAQWVPL